jgi:hypothetical protein
MSATIKERTRTAMKRPARPQEGSAEPAEAHSREAAELQRKRPPASTPYASPMQMMTLAWMPLTILLQYQALFVQSLLGLRYPAPYGPLQRKIKDLLNRLSTRCINRRSLPWFVGRNW